MAAYILRRLWHMLPTLVGVVLLVFFLFKGFGGDPAVILAGLNERRRELAILRAVGAGPRQMLALLAAEGLLVTGAGVVWPQNVSRPVS